VQWLEQIMISLAIKSPKGKNYLFKKDFLRDVIEELAPMFEQNHKETGVHDEPFNPDYQRYLFLERDGSLSFMTVRYDNKIVGYASFC